MGLYRPHIRIILSLWLGISLGPFAFGRDEGDSASPPSSQQEVALDEESHSTVDSSLLSTEVRSIDLASALRLADVQNPDVLLARQRVVEAVAERQLAAAQILPNLNAGTSYDNHSGNIQQSNGNILSVHRQALYLGGGSGAVAAGTVPIPGVLWNLELSNALYGYLIARQSPTRHGFAADATTNQVLLQVSLGYEELLRTVSRLAILREIRERHQEVANLTSSYAQVGQGRKADAKRAATELSRNDYDIRIAEAGVMTASARLCQLLDLDPSLRLHPADQTAVPAPIVADAISLPELIVMAMVNRPELKSQRVAIQQALLTVDAAHALPFSPNVIMGFSGGYFGGGSNLGTTKLGNFAGRTDFDVITYWSLRNLGVGNLALIHQAESRARSSNFEQVKVLNEVRSEVAAARAKSLARFAQIEISEQAVRSAEEAVEEDVLRIRNREGLPIEVLDSVRLLSRGRLDYLNAIIDYNQAQFELYVALGQPPVDSLARPASPEEISSPPPQQEYSTPQSR